MTLVSMQPMTHPTVLLHTHALCGPAEAGVLRTPLTFDITPGLTAITGDEGVGKSMLLRVLCGQVAPHAGRVTPGEASSLDTCALDTCCLDLRLPDDDAHTPRDVWQRLQGAFAQWDAPLLQALAEALQLTPHLDKPLFQLSTGSRRKVGLAASLASGATVVALDQPWVALDMASIHVLRDVLREAAAHPSRAWLVADYEADPTLPWRQVITLSR
jgi:ABC-type multidrug transport system ATPase subunit